MSSEYGSNIRVSIFGESHGRAIGAIIDNLPAGEYIDIEELKRFMMRRQGGNSSLTTPRKESDIPIFLSGVLNGHTTGAPLCLIINNENVRSQDYQNDMPRPGHADFTASVKYNGFNDLNGGGHFSGRLTAPLCAVGGILSQVLGRKGIQATSHIYSIKGERDVPFNAVNSDEWCRDKLRYSAFPVISEAAEEKMKSIIANAKMQRDSVGGIIECGITGVPAGVGDPLFEGIENKIAAAVFAVGAVKGIEFGKGFATTDLYGSENNDPFTMEEGKITTATNNHGGILGGISSGMPIIFRAAIKPTPSIGKAQQTVKLSTMQETTLEIKGRHDPCIVSRAAVCIESAAIIALADLLLK